MFIVSYLNSFHWFIVASHLNLKTIVPVYLCRKLFILVFFAENLALLYLDDYEIPDFVMMNSTSRKLGDSLVGATCVSTHQFEFKNK